MYVVLREKEETDSDGEVYTYIIQCSNEDGEDGEDREDTEDSHVL